MRLGGVNCLYHGKVWSVDCVMGKLPYAWSTVGISTAST